MTCLGFIWHYFNVKLHIFFSVCLLLELQSVSIHQFVQIPNTSVTERDRLKLVILGHFLPFYPSKNQKNQNFEKMKKTPGDIILHKCAKNHDHKLH